MVNFCEWITGLDSFKLYILMIFVSQFGMLRLRRCKCRIGRGCHTGVLHQDCPKWGYLSIEMETLFNNDEVTSIHHDKDPTTRKQHFYLPHSPAWAAHVAQWYRIGWKFIGFPARIVGCPPCIARHRVATLLFTTQMSEFHTFSETKPRERERTRELREKEGKRGKCKTTNTHDSWWLMYIN